MADEPNICEAFSCLADLGLAADAAPLNKFPGCWEYQIDERWWVAVNGHTEPKTCSKSTIPLKPFEAYVTFNGWPAFVLNPYGGAGAAGELANEDTFIAALKAATARATEGGREP